MKEQSAVQKLGIVSLEQIDAFKKTWTPSLRWPTYRTHAFDGSLASSVDFAISKSAEFASVYTALQNVADQYSELIGWKVFERSVAQSSTKHSGLLWNSRRLDNIAHQVRIHLSGLCVIENISLEIGGIYLIDNVSRNTLVGDCLLDLVMLYLPSETRLTDFWGMWKLQSNH